MEAKSSAFVWSKLLHRNWWLFSLLTFWYGLLCKRQTLNSCLAEAQLVIWSLCAMFHVSSLCTSSPLSCGTCFRTLISFFVAKSMILIALDHDSDIESASSSSRGYALHQRHVLLCARILWQACQTSRRCERHRERYVANTFASVRSISLDLPRYSSLWKALGSKDHIRDQEARSSSFMAKALERQTYVENSGFPASTFT